MISKYSPMIEKYLPIIKRYLPVIILPIIAIIVGIFCGYLTFKTHYIFFVILPLIAFALGYFSSWTGFLCGLFLFMGYCYALLKISIPRGDIDWAEVIHYAYPEYCFEALWLGGVLLLFIGALAPIIRSTIRKRGIISVASAAVIVTTTLLMIWFSSLAWSKARPRCECYYGISIGVTSWEAIDSLELYLPAITISGEIYEELYNNYLIGPGMPQHNLEFVDTDYGRMMKLTISGSLYESDWSAGKPHTYWIDLGFPKLKNTYKLRHLTPKYDVIAVDKTFDSGKFIWSLKGSEYKQVEMFNVPIMVKCGTDAGFELRMDVTTYKREIVNFNHYYECVSKDRYQELSVYESRTVDEFVLIPVEATRRLGVDIYDTYSD